MTALSQEELNTYLEPFVRDLDSCFLAPWIRKAFLKVPRHLFIDQFAGDQGVVTAAALGALGLVTCATLGVRVP